MSEHKAPSSPSPTQSDRVGACKCVWLDIELETPFPKHTTRAVCVCVCVSLVVGGSFVIVIASRAIAGKGTSMCVCVR